MAQPAAEEKAPSCEVTVFCIGDKLVCDVPQVSASFADGLMHLTVHGRATAPYLCTHCLERHNFHHHPAWCKACLFGLKASSGTACDVCYKPLGPTNNSTDATTCMVCQLLAGNPPDGAADVPGVSSLRFTMTHSPYVVDASTCMSCDKLFRRSHKIRLDLCGRCLADQGKPGTCAVCCNATATTSKGVTGIPMCSTCAEKVSNRRQRYTSLTTLDPVSPAPVSSSQQPTSLSPGGAHQVMRSHGGCGHKKTKYIYKRMRYVL